MKRIAFALALLLCLPCLPACGKSQKQSASFFFMDTVISVTLYTEEREVAEAAFDGCRELLGELDRIWTRHGNGDGSDVSSFNREQSGVNLDIRTVNLLKTALDVSAHTGGAFDITTAPLADLWRRCGEENRLPSEEELSTAMSLVGYEQLTLSEATLQKSSSDVTIDLGGIGKGGAMDALMAYLGTVDADGGLVTFGSNVAVFGQKPDGNPFRIALRDPRDAAATVGELRLLDGEVLSVSGDYERYVTIQGERYHHIIDPATGYPSHSGLSSVTVVCSDGALADALSTALLVMGKEGALNFYSSGTYRFEAVLISSDGELTVTDGLAERFAS